MIYHVSVNGCDSAAGTKEAPFRTINRAAAVAAPGEHHVIKGSEIVTDWEQVKGTVWKKVLPNAMFGN